MTPPSAKFESAAARLAHDFQALSNQALTTSNAVAIRNEVANIMIQNNQGAATAFLPTDAQLGGLVNEMRRTMGLPHSGREGEIETQSPIPEDHLPILSESSTAAHGDAAQNVKWLPLPPNSEAKQAVLAMFKDAMPHAAAQQDGLKIFCKAGEASGFAAGDKLSAGAALLAPKNQIQAMLNSVAIKLATPEATRALALLQAILPAALIGVEPAALAKVLGTWVQASATANLDAKQVISSLVEMLHQSGLGSMDQVQQLLGHLLQEFAASDSVAGHPDLMQSLNQQVLGLSQSGSPLLGGLKEMMGGNLWQGMNQILQPLMRILTGLFLTKPEAQFPKSLPDEATLAGLATMFAAASRRREKKRSRKQREPKRRAFGFHSSVPEPELAEEEDQLDEIRECIPAFA